MTRIEWIAERLPIGRLWPIRYYAIGLALQKGTPLLVLPLIVATFGRSVFGEYILIYTSVQILANLGAVSVPAAVVPLWFRNRDPAAFARLCYRIVFTAGFVTTIFALILAISTGFDVGIGLPPLELALWVGAFALIYNLGQTALSVVRARERPMAFLLGSLASSGVLIAGILLARNFGETDLRLLLAIQVGSLFAGLVPLVVGGRGGELPTTTVIGQITFRPLLAFALPLAGYTLIVLAAMSIDKWAARAWFDGQVFEAYVVDYQAAFSMMFVPVAINMFAGPQISAMVARGRLDAVRAEERRTRLFAAIGSIGVALVMSVYAVLTGLSLTMGFWVLALGFIFEGQYVICSNRVMAEMRSGHLLATSLAGLAVYIAVLGLAGILGSQALLYLATPIYLGTMLILVNRPSRTAVERSA